MNPIAANSKHTEREEPDAVQTQCLDEVMEQALDDARPSAELIADFDEALDAAIPPGYTPQFVKGLGRYSKKNQKKGTSESRQVGRILAVCARYGWPKPAWILLRGVSAWRKNKKGIPHNLDPEKSELGRFIANAGAGKVPPGTLLIVDNPDRFSRTNLDAADNALMTLLRNGVSVLFLSMQLFLKAGDQDNKQKRQDVMDELARANREGNTKSKYIRDGLTLLIKAAKAGKKVNFGGKVPRWVKWDQEKQDYVHGKHWETVCRIVREAVAQRTWAEIRNDLNRDQVPCLLGGKRWTHPSIYQLLRNPALRGDFTVKGTILKGYLPAVVSDETVWLTLQARLGVKNGKGGGSRPKDKVRNLFPGRVLCHHCGMPMRAKMDQVHGQSSYVCTGHIENTAAKGKKVCIDTRVVKVSAIEVVVFGDFLEQLPSTILKGRNEERQAELTRLRASISELDAKLTRLGRIIADGKGTDELHKDQDIAAKDRDALRQQEAELCKDAAADPAADAAREEVLQVLKRHSVADTSDDELDKLCEISSKLRMQLTNNLLRRDLIGPLKGMVSAIEIDVIGNEKRFCIKLRGGGHTEWYDVSELNAELIAANFKYGHSKSEAKVKMSEAQRARYARKPMSAEHRAAIGRGNKGKKRTAETRARISRARRAQAAKRQATSSGTENV